MSDRSLSPKKQRELGLLQCRIDQYVDKILDPNTSAKGREFLKAKLSQDYDKLKVSLEDAILENNKSENQKFDVYDKKTGQKVSGPYSNRIRANRAVDRLDAQYGAYRYYTKPVSITEAIHKIPITTKDFDQIKEMMCNPIPAAVAKIFIQDSIVDDELNAELTILEDTDPGRDVRQIIAEWFDRVMPDQMFHFRDGHERSNFQQQKGLLSPIHGYDPKMYKGSNDPITGDSYGFQ